MAGIIGINVYLPSYRMAGSTIASAWGRKGGSGERSVASHDEDAITMAVAAAGRVVDSARPGALYFVSSTPPLAEKSCAAIVTEALDLPETVRAVDFTGGSRAATSALLLALEARRSVLVVAGESRLAVPGSAIEPIIGDGAAAVLVGEGPALAEVRGVYSLTREMPDQWRETADPFVRSGDARFGSQGYEETVVPAVRTALEEWGLEPSDVAGACLGAPDARAARAALRKLGLKGPGAAAEELVRRSGMLGSAHPLALLAGCLGEARPGDKLLLVGYGDGVDVLLLEATERVRELEGLLHRVQTGARPIQHYNQYLVFRGLCPGQEPSNAFSSSVMLHRETPLYRRLVARECPACGFVLTLDLHTCPKCHHHGAFRARRLSRTGRVFATTQEWYYPSPEPPVTMAVVDLDGGGRLTTQVTDMAGEIAAGTPVELTFRRLHNAGKMPHYYWKARPTAGGDQP